MAVIVSTVSRRDSPFFTDDVEVENVIVSAESLLAAVSKERRVRVESSKNSVTTVLPRRAGTRGMARSLTSTKESVTRSTSEIPWAPRSATDRTWRRRGLTPVSTAARSWLGGIVLIALIGPPRRPARRRPP